MQPKRALIGLGICLALTGALDYNRTEHQKGRYERSAYQAIDGFSKTGDLDAATQELTAAGNEAVSRMYKVIEILNKQETDTSR